MISGSASFGAGDKATAVKTLQIAQLDDASAAVSSPLYRIHVRGDVCAEILLGLSQVEATATSDDCHFVLFSGTPLKEPIVSQGKRLCVLIYRTISA